MTRLLNNLGFNLRWGTAVDQRDIIHLKQQHTKRYRFEWHRSQRRVYCIDLETAVKSGISQGNLIGTDLETEGAAYTGMLMWLRGYRAGRESVSHDDQGKLILLGGK